MEIGQTLTQNQAGANAPAAAKATEISSDFETFLKMLTVQMQNQDPLNPIESSDYAVQLATFSGVEQQVQTNDLLRSLAGQMGAGGMAQMAGWVGMEARTAAPVNFDGVPVDLSVTPDTLAERAELVVTDDRGVEVQRVAVDPQAAGLTWAGVTADGAPLPPGIYGFEVVRYAYGAESNRVPAETYRRVTEVQQNGGDAVLVLSGGATVSVTEVTAVRDLSN